MLRAADRFLIGREKEGELAQPERALVEKIRMSSVIISPICLNYTQSKSVSRRPSTMKQQNPLEAREMSAAPLGNDAFEEQHTLQRVNESCVIHIRQQRIDRNNIASFSLSFVLSRSCFLVEEQRRGRLNTLKLLRSIHHF